MKVFQKDFLRSFATLLTRQNLRDLSKQQPMPNENKLNKTNSKHLERIGSFLKEEKFRATAMLRALCGITSQVVKPLINSNLATPLPLTASCSLLQKHCLGANQFSTFQGNNVTGAKPLLSSASSLQTKPNFENQVRTIIKFSLKDGMKESDEEVLKRFFRLNWGGWIRTIAGRHKSVWRKSVKRRRRCKAHVLLSPHYNRMLDKMVCAYWRKPKYWVETPYDNYHAREEYYVTAKKPRRPEGVDYE